MPRSSRTSPMTTRAPTTTNNPTTAAPWPRAAPVTIATLPSRQPMGVTRFARGGNSVGRVAPRRHAAGATSATWSDQGRPADPADAEVGLPAGEHVEVVAVRDQGTVAAVDRRAR